MIRKLITTICMMALATPIYADDGLSDAMLANFNTLITVFETETDSSAQQARVAKIIDFEAITRGVLKAHLATMSDEQQKKFQAEFTQSLTTLLETALQSAKEYEVTIERVQRSQKNPKIARVLGVLTSPRNERFELLTTVAHRNEQWMVRNLVINGVNLGITYRNQFNELLERNAGDVDATISAWADAVNQTAA